MDLFYDELSHLNELPQNYALLKVNLARDYIKLSPISSAIIPHRTPDGRLLKTGYVKLSAFSQVSNFFQTHPFTLNRFIPFVNL